MKKIYTEPKMLVDFLEMENIIAASPSSINEGTPGEDADARKFSDANFAVEVEEW